MLINFKKMLRGVGQTSLITTSLSYPLSSMAPVKAFVQRTALQEKIKEQLCHKLNDERREETKKVGVGT